MGEMNIKVLVACEESGRVTSEFRKRGIEAYSCDIIPTSGGHPEWHIQQDVLPLLDGNCEFQTCDGLSHKIDGMWDALIAFPPCVHLAVSGAPSFEKKRADGRQREGIEFFMQFLIADCCHIAVENPVNIISGGDYIKKWFPDLAKKYGLPIKPKQSFHPWNFGDNFAKKTYLWLKGLPPLVPEVIEEPELEYFEWIDKNGKKKRQPLWYFDALRNSKSGTERSLIRSKTFPGVARAIAEQWGNFLKSIKE